MLVISIFAFHHVFYPIKDKNDHFKLFPNKPWFLRVCCTTLLKTLWEKEKLLVTSNFSFSPSVFYLFEELSAISIKFKIVVCKLFQIGRVKNLSFGKGLSICILSSANALNLDQSEILSCGKELTRSHTITPFDAPGKQAF